MVRIKKCLILVIIQLSENKGIFDFSNYLTKL